MPGRLREVRITVRLFGSLREAIGASELSLSLPEEADLRALREQLGREHPPIARLGTHLRIAVNRVVAEDDRRLAEGDEVALLPPVSGGAGSDAISLSEHPLDVAEVMRRVEGPRAGAVALFVGTVRARSRGRDIRHLEYEAYAEMARPEMERVAEEARHRWPEAQVAIAHRVGRLAVGEIAVVVAAAAPHRGEAFAACRFAIDTLKQRVPIWKKEVTTQGDYWVEEHA